MAPVLTTRQVALLHGLLGCNVDEQVNRIAPRLRAPDDIAPQEDQRRRTLGRGVEPDISDADALAHMLSG